MSPGKTNVGGGSPCTSSCLKLLSDKMLARSYAIITIAPKNENLATTSLCDSTPIRERLRDYGERNTLNTLSYQAYVFWFAHAASQQFSSLSALLDLLSTDGDYSKSNKR